MATYRGKESSGQNSLPFAALFSLPLFAVFTLQCLLSFIPRNKQVNTSHPLRGSLSFARRYGGSDFTPCCTYFSLHLPVTENEIIAFLYAWRSWSFASLSPTFPAPFCYSFICFAAYCLVEIIREMCASLRAYR